MEFFLQRFSFEVLNLIYLAVRKRVFGNFWHEKEMVMNRD
jgi:hypothetical protein